MPVINPHDIPEQIAVKVPSHEPRPHSRRSRREKSGLLRRYVGYEFTRLSLSSSPNLPSGRRGNSCGDVPSGRGASPRRRRVQPGNRTLRPPVQRERGGGEKRYQFKTKGGVNLRLLASNACHCCNKHQHRQHQRQAPAHQQETDSPLCPCFTSWGTYAPTELGAVACSQSRFVRSRTLLSGRTDRARTKKEKKVGVLIHPTGSRLCYGEVPSLIAVLSSQKVKRAARRGMYTRGKSTENPKRYRPNVTQHKEDAPCKCYVRGQQTSGLAG